MGKVIWVRCIVVGVLALGAVSSARATDIVTGTVIRFNEALNSEDCPHSARLEMPGEKAQPVEAAVFSFVNGDMNCWNFDEKEKSWSQRYCHLDLPKFKSIAKGESFEIAKVVDSKKTGVTMLLKRIAPKGKIANLAEKPLVLHCATGRLNPFLMPNAVDLKNLKFNLAPKVSVITDDAVIGGSAVAEARSKRLPALAPSVDPMANVPANLRVAPIK